MSLEAWLVTDVGMVREHNEDSAHCDAARGVFIVADGMGGHAAGEVASAMAVEGVRAGLHAAAATIAAFVAAPSDAGRRALVQLVQDAVLEAHRAVYQRGQAEPDKAGMGTTLDVLLIAGPEAFVAHVGDSRTYLVRDGRASQITTDHTMAEVLVIEGKLTYEEAQVSPLRTILVNAIGVAEEVGVEMAHIYLRRGDRLLLCSDGLHDYFATEDEISTQLGDAAAATAGERLAAMVELAKARGGHDNITGVAIQVVAVAAHGEHDGPGPAGDDAPDTSPIELPLSAELYQDEPTETAVPMSEFARQAARAAARERETQPMRPRTPGGAAAARLRAEYGAGDTLPPFDPEPTLELPPVPAGPASPTATPDEDTGPLPAAAAAGTEPTAPMAKVEPLEPDGAQAGPAEAGADEPGLDDLLAEPVTAPGLRLSPAQAAQVAAASPRSRGATPPPPTDGGDRAATDAAPAAAPEAAPSPPTPAADAPTS